MEKTKIYARTLNPEDFDYRVYDISDDDGNEVIIDGGKDYSDIDAKDYLSKIKQLIKDYDGWDYEYYYHNSIKDFLVDMLPKKENGKKLSPREMHDIKEELDMYVNANTNYSSYETNCILKCLKVITGKGYKVRRLCGCCQGEVVTAYYPKDTSSKYVDFVEAWFFGTGTEVVIHEEESIPNDATEVSGYSFYTATWKIDELKKEIKENAGYKADDESVEVILWLYKDYHTIRVDHYELAE